MTESSEKFLQKTGNYRALYAYRKAEDLYDFTFRFTDRAPGDATPRRFGRNRLPSGRDQ
jgi:hypothetical protein